MTVLYAKQPVLKDRSFELTTLGPYILAWQDWLEFRRIAPKTRDNYEQDMSIVAKAYRHKAPEDFTAADIMALSKLFPPAARDVRMASVKSFFKWARSTKVIRENPFDEVPDVRTRRRRKDYDIFTEGEIDALVSLPIADGALMAIMLEAGLRKGECRNLQVRRLVLSEGDFASSEGAACGGGRHPGESATSLTPSPSESAGISDELQKVADELGIDLNPGSMLSEWARNRGAVVPDAASTRGSSNLPAPSESTGSLTVIGGKGDKDRTVQFGARLHGLLTELLFLEPMEPNDYLWYCRPGGRRVRRSQPILEGSFDFWWKRCLEAAGVRYRKPHTTRHTMATRWLRRGGRLTTLSEQLGHSSIAITYDGYGHLQAEDVQQDIAVIEGSR